MREGAKGEELIDHEIILNVKIMKRYIREGNIDGFFQSLPFFLSSLSYLSKNKEDLMDRDIFEPIKGTVDRLSSDQWSDEVVFDAAKNAILGFLASAVCLGRTGVFAEFEARIGTIEEAGDSLPSFLRYFKDEPPAATDAWEAAAASVGQYFWLERPPNPNQLFVVTCRLWNWLAYSDHKSLLGPILASFLTEEWRRILETQRFLLRAPLRTVPHIEDALDSSREGVEKIAEIALGADGAVGRNLSVEMRKLLERSLEN